MQVSCVTEGNFKKHKKSILRPKTRRPHFVKRLEPNVFFTPYGSKLTIRCIFDSPRHSKKLFSKISKNVDFKRGGLFPDFCSSSYISLRRRSK